MQFKEEFKNEYEAIKSHVKKLLLKVFLGFGSNKEDYLLFLAYVINTNDYKINIGDIDRGIQLLLSQVNLFWFNPNRKHTHEEAYLKRSVIKIILLEELERTIKALSTRDNPEGIKKFIDSNYEELQKVFEGKNLISIFSQNLSFATVARTSSWATHVKNEISSLFANVFFVIGMVLAAFSLTPEKKPDFEKNELALFILKLLSISIITAAITGFTGYKVTDRYIKYISSLNNKWTKLTMPQFREYCSGEDKLQVFTFKKTTIQNTWRRYSHLSKYEHKSPIFLRAWFHAELKRLKEDMHQEEFIKFLVSLVINEKRPIINDLPYPLPMEILNNPQELWLKGITFENFEPLLVRYLKLAIIEFINEELTLNNLFLTKRNVLAGLLEESSKEIISDIEKFNVNELEFRSNIKDKWDATIGLIVGIYGLIVLILTLDSVTTQDKAYQVYHQKGEKTAEFFSILRMLGEILLRWLSLSGVGGYVIYSGMNKAFNTYCNYLRDKSSVKLNIYFLDTFSKSPKLKAIFGTVKEPELSGEEEINGKIKMI